MPTDYVSDYEQVTGKKIPSPENVSNIKTKIISAPAVEVAPATIAEVK
jgi:hypothetical protein